MSKTLAALALVILAGCGTEQDAATPSKSLFSSWTATSGSGTVLNLTGFGFISAPVYFAYTSGAQCRCTLGLTGTETSGMYGLSSCVHMTGTGTGDPGCAGYNQLGSYSKPASELSICQTGGTCSTYR